MADRRRRRPEARTRLKRVEVELRGLHRRLGVTGPFTISGSLDDLEHSIKRALDGVVGLSNERRALLYLDVVLSNAATCGADIGGPVGGSLGTHLRMWRRFCDTFPAYAAWPPPTEFHAAIVGRQASPFGGRPRSGRGRPDRWGSFAALAAELGLVEKGCTARGVEERVKRAAADARR